MGGFWALEHKESLAGMGPNGCHLNPEWFQNGATLERYPSLANHEHEVVCKGWHGRTSHDVCHLMTWHAMS